MDLLPDEILPLLLEEIQNKTKTIRIRVKMMEGLVRSCQRFGEVLAPRAPLIVPVLMQVGRIYMFIYIMFTLC